MEVIISKIFYFAITYCVGIKPRFLFAVFYPNLHIIFNFALDQATACLRRLIQSKVKNNMQIKIKHGK